MTGPAILPLTTFLLLSALTSCSADGGVEQVAPKQTAQASTTHEAHADLTPAQTMIELEQYAHEAQSVDGVIEIRFRQNGLAVEILVEPWLDSSEALREAGNLEVTVVPAALNLEQRTSISAEITAAIAEEFGPIVTGGPVFDGFDATFIVTSSDWPSGIEPIASRIRRLVAQRTGLNGFDLQLQTPQAVPAIDVPSERD